MMNLRIFAASLVLLVILTIQRSKGDVTAKQIVEAFKYIGSSYLYSDDADNKFNAVKDFYDCMEIGKHSEDNEADVKECISQTIKNTATKVKNFYKDQPKVLKSALVAYCSMFPKIEDKNNIPLLNVMENAWGVKLPNEPINQKTYK